MQQIIRNPAIRTVAAHSVVIVGLFLLAILTVYRSFSEFGFYYDDWRFLQEVLQTGSLETVFPTRPLHRPLTELVFKTVALNPATGYVLLAILLISSALAMYWVMNVLFPRRRALAVITTVLYLLYPGDLSRTWITAGLTANRPAVLLALISLGLLFTGLRLRKRHDQAFRALAGAGLLIYLASLFLYEAQALLVPAMAFAGAMWISLSERGLSHRDMSKENLVGAVRVTAPFVTVFLLVMAWRFLLVQTGAEDRFTETANFSPNYLGRQLVGVYYFNFIEQPLEVVIHSVPYVRHIPSTVLILTVTGAALVVAPAVYFARRINRAVPSVDSGAIAPREPTVMPVETRFYRNLLIASLVLIGIVYIVLLPHDHIISASGLEGPFVSRLNAAAAVVVAIAAASGMMFLWSWSMTRWRQHRGPVNLAAAGALVAIVVTLVSFHGIVQRDYAEAWQLQQTYAGQVVDALPAAVQGSHIHISGVPSQYGSSYVFMYSIEHMLRLAYDDESLTATSTSGIDSKYRPTRDGLFLGDELIAPAERVWYFTLVPGRSSDCAGNRAAACGRLVMSTPQDPLQPDNPNIVTGSDNSAEHSLVLDLLGIEPPTSAGANDAGSDIPQFAAPTEPLPDLPTGQIDD